MDKTKLTVEVEVGPRFEIFYAAHKLFAPPTPSTERWRAIARACVGARLEREAREIVPDPLIWGVLADSTLATDAIGSFEDLTAAIMRSGADEFRETVLSGVPDVRASNAREQLTDRLRDAEDYRRRIVAVLREFWDRCFAADFATLRPELERMGRQMRTTSVSTFSSSLAERLSLPIRVDENAGVVRAVRGTYAIPIGRVGRIVLLPSAFNTNRWWTKRDDGQTPVDFYFPLSDGTITPNDALRQTNATPVERARSGGGRAEVAHVRPEMVFRALGDTTRYAIATILARTPSTPTQLAKQLRVSKPTITHHVHALRDAGLIVEGTDGGKLGLDRSKLEALSGAAVSALFSGEGKLKLARTRKH